jgi:putative Mn2+ efflux pump MntP
MDILTTIFIAIGLAMDAFAVSLGVGTGSTRPDRRSQLRLAFHFGIFQGLMTLLGWLAGSTIARWISTVDHWIAFGLLIFVGVNMLRSGIKNDPEQHSADPTRGGMMVMLSIATSIDAAAVGLSLAFIETPIARAVAFITVITFGLSLIGLAFGRVLGEKLGKRMEILGGLVLIFIGVRILIEHLWG